MTAPDIPEDIRATARDTTVTIYENSFLSRSVQGKVEDIVAAALLSERTRATEAERERCAKIAEAVRDKADQTYGDEDDDYIGGEYHAADRIASSIRTEGTAK